MGCVGTDGIELGHAAGEASIGDAGSTTTEHPPFRAGTVLLSEASERTAACQGDADRTWG